MTSCHLDYWVRFYKGTIAFWFFVSICNLFLITKPVLEPRAPCDSVIVVKYLFLSLPVEWFSPFVSEIRHLLGVHWYDRIAGLSGVNENLLKKYSVRLVAYDRPGIGQSDPQLKGNLNTSAEDMSDIADALGMGNKFWVFAHSGGAAYAWAALHYIPTRLAGNPYFF